jgi:ADP-heptose:LPS heptosyltransferase
MSRMPARLIVPPLALVRSALRVLQGATRKDFPKSPRTILIVHSMLLGDSMLLFSLMAKARSLYPEARIVVTVPKPLMPLFACQPAGVEALEFNPKDFSSVLSVLRAGPFDLAIVPAENRFSWLARAAGANHIVGFGGDTPAWKNWMLDTVVPLPVTSMAVGDLFTTLLPGPEPRPFVLGDWPFPQVDNPPKLAANAVIFHVASTQATRQWPSEYWRELGHRLQAAGMQPYWSIGPGEESMLSELDPAGQFPVLSLRFAPMWLALAQARALVSVDTSMVHLGRLAGVPTVVLFGPTHPELFGGGRFWQNAPFAPVFIEDIPCRDDGKIFRRPVVWARICTRGLDRCANPFCIRRLSVAQVEQSVLQLTSI